MVLQEGFSNATLSCFVEIFHTVPLNVSDVFLGGCSNEGLNVKKHQQLQRLPLNSYFNIRYNSYSLWKKMLLHGTGHRQGNKIYSPI